MVFFGRNIKLVEQELINQKFKEMRPLIGQLLCAKISLSLQNCKINEFHRVEYTYLPI